MRPVLGLLLAMMAGACPLPAVADAAPSSVTGADADYHRLRPQLAARAGNPAYDAALGIAALDSGRAAEAIAAFERVLAVEPGNHAIRTELARAYARVGDTAAAKREVEAVAASPAVPAPVRANLSHYASLLDEELTGGPVELSGYVHTAIGHDTNVNTATDSSYLLIPAFGFLGPARLDDGLSAEKDWFAEIENGLALRVPYAPGRQFFASSRLHRRQMARAHAFNQMSASGELGWQVQTPDDGWFSLGLSAQQVWFAEQAYSASNGVYGAWRIPLDALSALTLYGNASHTRYAAQPDRDAARVLGGATYQRALREDGWQPTAFIGGYAGFEETDTGNADFWSHRLAGLTMGVEAYPRPTTSVFLEAGYEVRDHSDDYPLFLRPRFDRQADIGAGLAQQLPWKLTLRPRVAWRNTESNIGFYDYARWVGEVQLRRTF